MARTPLLQWLQGLSAESSPRITRRQMLAAGGAAAGAAVLGGPLRALAAVQPRIAIIGAGISGLNAALTLADAGHGSTVYEAADHVGGRMHSDTTTWDDHQVSEHCGELIDSAHGSILGLIDRFKLTRTDLHAAEPSGSTDTYRFFGGYYARSKAIADFVPVQDALNADNNAAPFPTQYNSGFGQAAFDLDHMSVHKWIETRVPGGHKSRMGALLDVAYNIEFGAPTSQQSALNIIYLLGFQPAPGAFEVFGTSDERFHIAGGNEKLPRAIAAALPRGSVRLRTALTKIVRNGNGSYTLTFDDPDGTFDTVADRVILAIPFSVLRRLDYSRAGFNQVKVTGIKELGYGANGKLHLQFKKRLWNQHGPWGVSTGTSFSDTGYQNSWDVSRGQQGVKGILVDYTTEPTVDAGETLDARAHDFLERLEPVFPGISAQWTGRATFDFPLTNPLLRGSYSYWKVGQYTLFSGSEGQRSGRCHFAGEHCSNSFQGFMEGGAEEGARAAGEILADYAGGVFP
jgi:monoamine oxidase